MPTVTAWNKPRPKLTLSKHGLLKFCLMKNFPEFLNLEYPVILGCHLCRLVDSYRPFERTKCLHLQGQAVQELVPSGFNSSLLPAV